MKPQPERLSALARTFVPLAYSTLVARPALAAESNCPAISLEVSADFREQFPGLEEEIRADLVARPDVDACARIALQADAGSSIQLAVSLPDGRRALRRVIRQVDVLPTLRALVLIPEGFQTEAHEQAAPPWPRPASPVAPIAPVDGGATTTRTASERSLGFELSLMTGARVGDGQIAAGGGVLSFLEVRGFLFGFLGRGERYQAISGSDPEFALELGLLAGKRLDFGSVALDLTLGPAVAVKGVSVSETETVRTGPVVRPPPPRQADPSTGPVPRLLLGARCGFSPHSVLRSFVGLDAEFGPARQAGRDETPEGASLPRFEVGFVLGATLGTR